ncbi:MAG: hypothetical protein ACUVR2_00415 [Anaerolineae bacterium]
MVHSPWNDEERAFLAQLDAPWKIQQYLDSIPYNTDQQTRSPRRVMRDGRAHCLEGALFAAAALRFHGHPPLIINLRAVDDDDHVIAIYRVRGLIGAIAKSNFSLLRFREPVYRNYRELALSYFESYYNILAERTLRAYSRPLDLSTLDDRNWMTTEEDLDWIGKRLDALRHYPLIDEITAHNLQPVDDLLYRAGLLSSDPTGLYKPKPTHERKARGLTTQ